MAQNHELGLLERLIALYSGEEVVVADTLDADAFDVTIQDQTKESDKWSITVNDLKQYNNSAEVIVWNSLAESWKGAVETSELGYNGLEWLDNQPIGSVIFVSFGCSETLSFKQLITELALGVQVSGARFLWYVKSSNDTSSNAAFLGAQSQDNPISFSLKGLLGRTKGQGLVVPSWAPQIGVLAHGWTGGFVTRCGCNSTLESVDNCLLLIAWPLYAGPKTNAVMLNGGLNMALRLRVDENGPSRMGGDCKCCEGTNEREKNGRNFAIK